MPRIVVFISKCDTVDDGELAEMVETEVGELLPSCGFSSEDAPIIQENALAALKGEGEAQKGVSKLIGKMMFALRVKDPLGAQLKS